MLFRSESACQPFIAQLPATCDSQNCVFIPCTAEGVKNFETCLTCEVDAAPADVTAEEIAAAKEYIATVVSGQGEGCADAGNPLTSGTETPADSENEQTPAPGNENEEETTPAPGNANEEKPAGNPDNNAAAEESDKDSGALRTSSMIGALAGAVGAVLISL